MKRFRLMLPFLLVLALAWTGVTTVQAHAMLMRSIPDANATLSTAPAQVELFFSEAIDPMLSKISVIDTSNMRMDTGNSMLDSADATHLMVSLQPLSDGVYTVEWTAVSASDGHQTMGSFPFAVGNVAAGALTSAQTPTTSSSFPIGLIVTKVFLYLAAAAVVGGILFAFLVWNPSLHQAQFTWNDFPAYLQFSRNLLLGALAVLAAADVISLFAQVGQVNGTLMGWPWQPTFATVLLDTRFGVIAIARLGMIFILAGLLLPRPNRWNRWAGLAIGLLFLFTFSLESHAAGEPQPVLPLLADWIHFAAISAWVGGLLSFLGGIWVVRKLAPESQTRITSLLIPHFTILAMSSVGVMVLTGIYAAYLRIGTPVALLDTTYGRVMLLKLLTIVPMLGLGGFHFLITTPIMRRATQQTGGSPRLVRLFHWLLVAETTLGVMVLVIVGVFTTLPPVRAVATAGGITKTTKADDLRVTLNISPGKPGINTFTATITSGGVPVTDAQDVSLEFNSMSGMMPASKTPMVNDGNGVYHLEGGYLNMPDQWDVKVVVIRPGKFDAYADYRVTLSQPVATTVPWRLIAEGLAILLLLSIAFSTLSLHRSPAREWSWA
jgi:copper transport protein